MKNIDEAISEILQDKNKFIAIMKIKTEEELSNFFKNNGYDDFLHEEFLKKWNEVRSKEFHFDLEDVNGGGCSTYSSDTYQVISGGFMDVQYQKNPDNHPLIVTAGNTCNLHLNGRTCASCSHSYSKGPVLYCLTRSKERDPVKNPTKF